jgi:hypothetical protein
MLISHCGTIALDSLKKKDSQPAGRTRHAPRAVSRSVVAVGRNGESVFHIAAQLHQLA